jgi:centromeric protein E
LLLAGSVDNTRAALHFATAAGRVVMRPQLNKVASNKAVIKAMAAEIMQLKSRLVS